MAPRLKVFTWSDGFHAFTVAASSRPKALEAWGLTGDIFKTGLGSEAPDGPDKTAALASPGAVITRGLAIDVGETTARKPKQPSAAAEKAKARVAELEQRLELLDADQAAALSGIDDRLAALQTERDGLERDQAKTREALKADLRKARTALR